MIKIEKAESYRCCNSCDSNKNVININALIRLPNSTTHGLQMALCEDCCKSLIEQLEIIVDYERASDMRDYCVRYEPTYNCEDGSM